ncbi:hypothetical protein BAOM_3206 [Peribacillus asahii]|uniref:Uncharacterized protein n=1 Tax=Peribacillus asahii TaxID=228899 RepID=A0A3T0KUA6_9BACI|nr:hypothetical protein BAOM_3206 [Peribacillus asahii]USK83555.1 hypothetical protein LIT35_13915 [Peribacillus asahii]
MGNPDCGLKTRKIDETFAALKRMVDIAKILRERYKQEVLNVIN